MRLIRSVSRPADIVFPLRFQMSQDTKISSACLHSVLTDASNLGHGSNILRCDRLYASASAATSALEDGKLRKRPSKDERRTMVETYVNEYRITNDGKFPSVTLTKKEVGGGYYAVRQIIQEMIYNSKQSSTASKYFPMDKSTAKKNEMTYNSKKAICSKDIYSEKSTTKDNEIERYSVEKFMYTMDASLEKSSMQEDEISPKFEEVPQTREPVEGTRPLLKDIEDSSSMISQTKQDQQSFVAVETDEPKDVGAQFHHLIDKPESSRNLNYEKEHEIREDKVMSDALEHKAGPLESSEIPGRGMDDVLHKYDDSQKKSSVWNNLKSFANGILSIWKRS